MARVLPSLSHELSYRVFCEDVLNFLQVSNLERIDIICHNDDGIVSMKLEIFR